MTEWKSLMAKQVGYRERHGSWGCPCCSGRVRLYGCRNDRAMVRRIVRRHLKNNVRRMMEE